MPTAPVISNTICLGEFWIPIMYLSEPLDVDSNWIVVCKVTNEQQYRQLSPVAVLPAVDYLLHSNPEIFQRSRYGFRAITALCAMEWV
jgi:hypothetical protein